MDRQKIYMIILGIIAVGLLSSIANAVNDQFQILVHLTPNITIYSESVSGAAGDKWVDAGSYIYPNSTFANNVKVFGYIHSTDWSNVSITESQITDLQSYLISAVNLDDSNITSLSWSKLTNYPSACASGQAITQLGDSITCSAFVTSESDPQWLSDKPDYMNNATLYSVFFSDIANFTGTLTNNKYCTYNQADNTIVCNSDTSITETDPYWTANQSNYYNKSEVDTLDTNTNTSVVNWVNDQGFLKSVSDLTTENITSIVKDDILNSGTLGFTWSDSEVSDTLTCSDLVSASSVVSDSEVDNDITIASSENITTTEWVKPDEGVIVSNGTTSWKMWVNASGYFIIEEI